MKGKEKYAERQEKPSTTPVGRRQRQKQQQQQQQTRNDIGKDQQHRKGGEKKNKRKIPRRAGRGFKNPGVPLRPENHEADRRADRLEPFFVQEELSGLL